MKGWIGVDLDGTLAYYDKWRGVEHIGEPIPLMVDRVKRWIEEGKDVRIFTARMSGHGLALPVNVYGKHEIVDVATPIKEWCELHLGRILPITNVKDYGMVELWDDRCIQLIPNTGKQV